MKKVSVLVPIYNVEEHLEKCLNSLVHQTYGNYELLCVNDGSTDSSLSILKKFHQEYPHLIQVISQENGGLSSARNTALKAATGEYIMCVDSDDDVELNFIELAANAAQKSQVDMVIFGYYQYFQDMDQPEIQMVKRDKEIINLKEDPGLLVDINNAVWNKLISRKLLEENNLIFPVGMRYEDFVLILKSMMIAENIAIVNQPLYHYKADRIGNISTTYDEKIYDLLAQCKEFMGWIKGTEFYETYKEQLMITLGRNAVSCLRKVMNVKDKKFVMHYIQEHFQFLEKEFPEYKNQKEKIKVSRDDGIYLSSIQTKLYYNYRQLRRKYG